jgi:ribosomal protein S27AE
VSPGRSEWMERPDRAAHHLAEVAIYAGLPEDQFYGLRRVYEHSYRSAARLSGGTRTVDDLRLGIPYLCRDGRVRCIAAWAGEGELFYRLLLSNKKWSDARFRDDRTEFLGQGCPNGCGFLARDIDNSVLCPKCGWFVNMAEVAL